MKIEVLQQLADKSMTKEALLQRVKQDFNMLPIVIESVSSPKAAVR